MISYFTDGSASPNPGPGGFAVIKDGRPWLVGGEQMTTNIRMEGLALMAALIDAGNEKCEITTDSEFWINVLTKWAPIWANNSWTKKGGIKNLDIVQPLFEKYKQSYAKLTWTRGHVGDELNELADEWANKARQLRLRDVVKVDTIDSTS
ncbi:MAG: ribonuclease HI [Candidatus Nomurabacteria bacterium]|nr:ribonuclease HI [Candidatus Nomurabacteria bacterium]